MLRRFQGWLINKRYYLHKIDKIYINLKTKNYEIYLDKKFMSPVHCLKLNFLQSYLGFDDPYFPDFMTLKIDDESFEKIITIVKENEENDAGDE